MPIRLVNVEIKATVPPSWGKMTMKFSLEVSNLELRVAVG